MKTRGEPSRKPERIGAFAEAARQTQPPPSERHHLAGWYRLRQTLVSRERVDEHRTGWRPSRGSRLAAARVAVAVVVAAVAAAVVVFFLGPLGRFTVRRVGPQAIQYVVSGESGGLGSRGVTGGVLSAPTGRVQLSFTDGSRIDMRSGARVTVAALRFRGSEIRLLDGMIDVEVRHQPGAAWTFEAGPYAVQVEGTSFALGWDAARKRLDLKMRSGAVAVVGPASAAPLAVVGGESLFLDGAGNSLDPAAVDAVPAAALAPIAVKQEGVVDANPAADPDRNRRGQGRIQDRNQDGIQDRNQVRIRDRRLPRTALGHAEWAPLLARGDFDGIVEQANHSGIGVCLAFDTERNLATLADAARYTHRGALARRALVALRARFPASDRARDAAFFLGRMSETSNANARQALSWYQRYLREAASGSYVEEALGRAMILLRRSGGGVRARRVAGRYLEAFPHGVYSTDAARLLADHAVP
jgi:ferric-dicitrate binding protein FerR (iron transport regulator)